MKRRSLDGEWQLSYQDGLAGDEAGSARVVSVAAQVPGNVELDLSRAGRLPSDLFHGENILTVRALERYEWCYRKVFTLTPEEAGGDLALLFGAVDGDAEYLLNGQQIGWSSNSLIEHLLPLGGHARSGENELVLHLRPQLPPAEGRTLTPLWLIGEPLRDDSVWVRKAAHVYGWDIMPRALSAGIWRHVDLVEYEALEITQLYLATTTATEHLASIRVYYEIRGSWDPAAAYELVVTGTCGPSTFHLSQKPFSAVGAVSGEVSDPQLWWPCGYGEAALYTVTSELRRDGLVVARRESRVGIRTVEVIRQPSQPSQVGEFHFVVNGTAIYCRGTNWVPVDPFHSRDLDGLPGRLALLSKSNCNMVRCWGGNVYENDAFFDYCDEHGIMVWQDFSLACALYPQTEGFVRGIENEVRAVARRLRGHPSIVLWCGDNEGDQVGVPRGVRPDLNVLTRRVIPETIAQEDPHRPYLPSSPYISDESDEVMRTGDMRWLPETHLWGPRDYFKSDFYVGATARFVSEIGFMGLPAIDSLRRFLDEEALWPFENRQWLVHGTDPTVDFTSRYWHRTAMTLECVRQFFGRIPEKLEDIVLASQIFQAEGFKFAIERGRQGKWDRTGVIWWNLADGWPQISDAVADYYLTEKLALSYIARSQRALALLVGEAVDGRHPILACNDTRRDVAGRFRLRRAGADEPVMQSAYSSPANSTVQIGSVTAPDSQALFVLDWEDPDGAALNHYLVGVPPFDLAQYTTWLDGILTTPTP